MTNQNPGGNGRFRAEMAGGAPARQIVTELLAQDRRVNPRVEPPRPKPNTTVRPLRSQYRRADWQMVALWAFVAVSFAALAFAGYMIWAKCRGASPF